MHEASEQLDIYICKSSKIEEYERVKKLRKNRRPAGYWTQDLLIASQMLFHGSLVTVYMYVCGVSVSDRIN